VATCNYERVCWSDAGADAPSSIDAPIVDAASASP
jgi:hypothetical protein